jgi:hypothetical protein
LSLVALLLALALMELALPAFNRLFDKELAFTGRAFGLALPLLCSFVLLGYRGGFLSCLRSIAFSTDRWCCELVVNNSDR